MMSTRARFTPEQEEWLREHYYSATSYDDLTEQFNDKFNTNRKKDAVREKCVKRLGLKGMANPTVYGVKSKEQLAIGSIRKSQTGTYIKVGDAANSYMSGYREPYWLPLQKKIYQDAHGEIEPHQMICFLDGNRDNFDLDNLYCIDRRISALMAANKWWTDSREHTLTAIKWCELYVTLKDSLKGDLYDYQSIRRHH
jgi:hypothetical protein